MRRCVGAWAALVAHSVREQMWWGGRVGLRGGHLGHEVVGVDRMVLLLVLEQVGVQRVAEWRGLGRVQVVASEEAVEVDRARVRDVELVGGEAVALRAEVRRVVLRQGLGGLEEARVGQHLVLLREGLRLHSGQVL